MRTEQAKLLAGWFDRASTACITVGLLAPIAAAIYAPVTAPLPGWTFTAGISLWLLAALALHLMARIILEGIAT